MQVEKESIPAQGKSHTFRYLKNKLDPGAVSGSRASPHHPTPPSAALMNFLKQGIDHRVVCPCHGPPAPPELP